MTERSDKILVLGLELGDGALLRGWAEQGHLPAIRRLLDRGRAGTLATTAEILHVSPLPSLYTGAEPGQHGIYFTFQPAPGVQGWERFQEGIYGAPTVWKLLSDARRRCTVFDVPYCHPEPGFNGLYVGDWGTWAHYLAPRSVPEGLLKELEREAGRYPLGLEAHDLGFAPLDPAALADKLVAALEARTKATRWLMTKAPWDLFFTVLDETHPAAHYCWIPPADGAAEAPADQPHLLKVYKALDRTVGALVEAAGDDATVVLVSGDAIGVNRAGWHLLPDVLARLGLYVSADAPAPPPGDEAPAAGKPKLDPVKMVRDLLPKDFRKQLARMLPTGLRDKLAKRVDTAAIDWSRTKAYCLLTDLEGCIRINLEGREPQGVVAPGAAFEQVMDEIETALRELVNPRTGRPAVTRILRADRDLRGDRRDRLPDLVVHWSREAPITELRSERIGTVGGICPDPRPGTHAGPGFAIVARPAGSPGTLPGDAHIFDLAPSILACFGLEKPPHMAGTAWPDLSA
jgi:predicted AlkP superfamily phosphohydrolase/phosphomutase